MDRFRFKYLAKDQIKGKIGVLFLVMLIIFSIAAVTTIILSKIHVVGALVAGVLVSPAFTLSIHRVYLMVVEGHKPEAADAFCGFDDFWNAFKLAFLVGLFTFLWSLLLIVPGIIKSYSYSMSFFILAENPGKPPLECIAESKEMTEGHKLDLFILDLSFIGWLYLCAFTLGIASIWAVPYMSATVANVYKSLKIPEEAR